MTLASLSTCDADALRGMLTGNLRPSDGLDSVFRARAVVLAGTLAPALIWLRDAKGTALTSGTIRSSSGLRWLWRFCLERVAMFRDPETGIEREIGVDPPEEVWRPLFGYLVELPGAIAARPLEQQGDEPARQHSYVLWHLNLPS